MQRKTAALQHLLICGVLVASLASPGRAEDPPTLVSSWPTQSQPRGVATDAARAEATAESALLQVFLRLAADRCLEGKLDWFRADALGRLSH